MSGFALNQHTLTADQGAVGESGRAARVADAAFPQRAKEVVMVQSRTMTADDPAFRAAIADSSPGCARPALPITSSGALSRAIATQRSWRSHLPRRRDDDTHVGRRAVGGR